MRTCIALLTAVAAWAQVPLPRFLPGIPPELREFLNLSEAQAAQILRINSDYGRYAAQKNERIAQVNFEIEEWTSKEPIDPFQLGLRYAELEAIRRDLRDEKTRLRPRILEVLNDGQKQRLRMLEDARKLQALIGYAECQNMLEPPPASPGDAFTRLLVGRVDLLGLGCGLNIVGLPFP